MSEDQEIDCWVAVLGGRVKRGGKIISYAPPLRGLDMWKQRGQESRCMGIQKSLHMHGAQTGKIMLTWDSKQWIWRIGVEANCSIFDPVCFQIWPVLLHSLTDVLLRSKSRYRPR